MVPDTVMNIRPVSYTHLDVYKRQHLYGSYRRIGSYKDCKDVLKHFEPDDPAIHSICPADKSGRQLCTYLPLFR